MFDTVNILETYGYVGMFIISFLESGIFFLLPGDSLLFTAGILSAGGYLNIYITMSIFFVGSFLGSLAGYYIGDKLEDLRLTKFGKKYLSKIFSEKHMSEASDFFKQNGESTLLFCRFVPIVRTFVPVVAGAVNMNYRKFVIYNFIGAFIWSTSLVGLGYLLGNAIPGIEKYLSYIIIFILVITTGPATYKIYKKYNKSKA